jgi:quercetin dioxygenase-like cupin family protein
VPHSRRDLALLIAALTAGNGKGQSSALPSKTFKFEDLPVRENGQNRGRPVLKGDTHRGVTIQLHETELAPGLAPHPPHRHSHEEMIFVREGTLEVTIAGQASTVGPGSVACVASNDEHGWRNTGSTRAHYFVLAIDPGKA